jgi:hypothetical protein
VWVGDVADAFAMRLTIAIRSSVSTNSPVRRFTAYAILVAFAATASGHPRTRVALPAYVGARAGNADGAHARRAAAVAATTWIR